MPSMFAGLQQQYNALPAPVAAPTSRRHGLFGGRGPSGGDLAAFAMNGLNGVHEARQRDRQSSLADQERARIEAFAATIPDPRERQIFLTAPGEWAKNNAQQFAPQVVGAGAAQVVNGRRTVEQPTYAESGDQTLRRDSVGVAPAYTRTEPSIAERIQQQNADSQRITATRPQIANLSVGEQAFGVGPQGQVQPLAQNSQPRPIPEAVRRDNEKDQMAIDDRTAVIARLDNSIGLIQNDMINLDPMSRASAWIRNSTGNSSPQSQAAAELRRTVETLRNNILNDATGPQTDGDSLRALNQIIQGWGDETVVMQGIQAYRDIQARKNESQRRIMAQREAQYGGAQGQPQAAPQGRSSGPIAVNPQTGQRVQFNGSQWVPIP